MRNKKNVTKISSSAPAIIFNGILAMDTSFVDKGKEAITSTQERYNNVKELNKAAEEKMNESVKEYEKTFVILSNEIENLEKITEELRFSFKHLGIPITPSEYEIAKANQQAVNIENDLSAESVLKGAAVGSLASGSAVLLASAFGTAGTGAAISSLSGIYALKAALAVLGGGTLASGGLGVMGGVAVASGLFIVPALAAGGFIINKKLQELEKNTEETVAQVEKAIELNEALGERNLNAARKIRQLYDLGIRIKFLLSMIASRFSFSCDHTMINAVKDKLGETFFAIKIFSSDGQEINPEMNFFVREIESDVCFLQEAFASQKLPNKEKYTEKEITPVFRKLYEDAQKYIYLSYPWYNQHYVELDLPLIEKAAKNGVKVMICYGIGNDDEDNRKLQKTKSAVRKIEAINSNIKSVRINSHMKIALCEKYVLYGSQNMMTYRYDDHNIGKGDLRSEITIKDTDVTEIEDFRNIIKKKIYEAEKHHADKK